MWNTFILLTHTAPIYILPRHLLSTLPSPSVIQVNDRAIADEMEHLMHSARDSPLVPEIQLTEPRELPLPLLLPPDGYASDTILTGAPTGLVDFFRPLESKRLIHLRRNTVDGIRINQRPWTNYLRLIQVRF